MEKVIGYLSGAPRVSTRSNSEAGGPRAHVTGVIRAFGTNGWKVLPYIVGDKVPQRLVTNAERHMESSAVIRFGADLARMALSRWHAHSAWRELGQRVDLVYERFGVLQSMGRPFGVRGIPWVVETNGIFFQEAVSDRKALVLQSIAKRMEIATYRSADMIVAVTDALKQSLVEHAHLDEGKVLIMPNGVDVERFNPIANIPESGKVAGRIVFAGNLVGWQSLDILLRAVDQVRKQGFEYSVLIVGDGPMKSEWVKLSVELGIADSVTFAGRVTWDEVPRHIASGELCYSGQVPLRTAAMYHSPLKLYEYMAMARPVIASAYEDACRVVRDGETGFLFDGGSLQSLVDALRRAWRLRSGWALMGGKARSAIVAEHSWHERVRKMSAQIEARISERGGAR